MTGSAIRIALLALPLLLTACAPLQPARPAAPAAIRAYQQSIELGGRLSVRYETLHGEEALHGGFQWSQAGPATSVVLLSPLGQAMARIDVTPATATLLQAGQPARSAPDPDTLTATTLGWPLPVAGLRDWLQGFAIDEQGRQFIASPQNTSVNTRDGWLVLYPAWVDDGAGTPRPRRIDLSRRTAQAGEVAIRIVIDTWQPTS